VLNFHIASKAAPQTMSTTTCSQTPHPSYILVRGNLPPPSRGPHSGDLEPVLAVARLLVQSPQMTSSLADVTTSRVARYRVDAAPQRQTPSPSDVIAASPSSRCRSKDTLQRACQKTAGCLVTPGSTRAGSLLFSIHAGGSGEALCRIVSNAPSGFAHKTQGPTQCRDGSEGAS
jgi:hypothetical protein